MRLFAAAFAIVPVPILLFVALITLLIGTDHPNGKWSDRHKLPASRRSSREEYGSPRLVNDTENSPAQEKLKDDDNNALVNVNVKEAPRIGMSFAIFTELFH